MDLGIILFIFFFTGIASGVTCSMIASARGVSSGGWFILGILFNFMAILFVSIALQSQARLDEKGLIEGTRKRCNYCEEIVKRRAVKCRYCHHHHGSRAIGFISNRKSRYSAGSRGYRYTTCHGENRGGNTR